MSDQKPQVVVVGAGFSGLIAAWHLVRAGFDVSVVDRDTRAGGLIETQQTLEGSVETAANGLLYSSMVAELFRDCSVPLARMKPDSKRRFLCVDGDVTRWPLSVVETLRVVWRVLKIKKSPPAEGESVAAWTERVLGRAAAEKVVAPALLGIFAASASLLSARAIFGRYYVRSRRSGRKRGTIAPKDGMSQLMMALVLNLKKRGVRFQFSNGWNRSAVAEAVASGRHVVLATSAWSAAELVADDDAPGSLKTALRSIKPIPLVSVTAFFNRRPIVTGFGVLFQEPNDGVLGVLQNTEIFEGRAARGIHSETWILGGAMFGGELIGASEERLLDLIHWKRESQLDPNSREVFMNAVVTRWPKAIPLYDDSVVRHRSRLLKGDPGISLFGNYLGEIGLSSIVELGAELVERVRSKT